MKSSSLGPSAAASRQGAVSEALYREQENCRPKEVEDRGVRPSRILVIPDGHRRYAQKTGLSYRDAYHLGAIVAAKVASEVAAAHLVPHLTLFPLTTKNFDERDRLTLMVIFAAIGDFLDAIVASSQKMRLSVRGSLQRIPRQLADRLIALANASGGIGEGNVELQLLVDYDGQADLESMTRAQMVAALAQPYDIVVRTGGAFRLSGAPILESSSADMFALPMTFPEFTYEDLVGVVRRFVADKRRRILLRQDRETNHHVRR